MNEIALTRNIRIMLKREFPAMYVQRVSDKFLSGLPDLRLISHGLSGDIEVKISSSQWNRAGRVSPIQAKILENIAKAGGAQAVVFSVEEARLFAVRLQSAGREYQQWLGLKGREPQ